MNKKHIPITLYLLFYSLISFLTLNNFPFVHSDEPWLASLSLEYSKSNSIFVTEPFFDIMPRIPHTFRSIFHILQTLFISLFGYNITSVRLLSLIGAILVLVCFYLLIYLILQEHLHALLANIMLSVNLQFVYASHFARQEILMLVILVVCYYIYHRNLKQKYIIIPTLIGLSIGIHPNSFVIAIMMGIVLLKDYFLKNHSFKKIIGYCLILGLWASLFLGLNLYATENFISSYFTYGSKTFSINAGPMARIQNFIDFYIKIYKQISGTYYLPPIKLFLIITGLSLIISSIHLIIKKVRHQSYHQIDQQLLNSILMFIAYNIGIFIIGRYNTTSILFILLPCFLNVVILIYNYITKNNIKNVVLLSLIILSLFPLDSEYNKYKNNNYSEYLSEFQPYIDDDSIVLGNLSSGFLFENIEFYDIRNFDYLDHMSITEYIELNNINTIIYYEEYDYIHRNKEWQILYGEDVYYEELNALISTKGELIHSFESPYYGNRIVRYINDYPWKVSIYRID